MVVAGRSPVRGPIERLCERKTNFQPYSYGARILALAGIRQYRLAAALREVAFVKRLHRHEVRMPKTRGSPHAPAPAAVAGRVRRADSRRECLIVRTALPSPQPILDIPACVAA